jgi:hypothetical protein
MLVSFVGDTMKKPRYSVGGIYEIPLGDSLFAYARALVSPLMAFYDVRAVLTPPIEEIVQAPIIFKIYVMRYAITSGRWQMKGSMPLDDDLKQPVTFFKQDALRRDLFFLYRDSQDIPAMKEQCVGLERASVWEPEHVEERLRDYFSGRKNYWVEFFRVPD